MNRTAQSFGVAMFFAVYAFLLAAPGVAGTVRPHAAEADLVSPQAAIVAGGVLELGLRLKLDPGWHVYWKNAGDSGTPPTLQLRLPEGFKAGELQFPFPRRIPIAHLVNYGFEGEVLFPLRIEVPANVGHGGPITLRARADWLECRESCLPATANLELVVPVSSRPEAGPWLTLFEATRARLPAPLPQKVNVSSEHRAEGIALRLDGLGECRDAEFFPDREGVFVHAKIQRVAGAASGLRFTLPVETNATVPGVLSGVVTCGASQLSGKAYEVSVPIVTLPRNRGVITPVPVGEPLTLGFALLFAFLGGLALNLMPCVFPVLGLKILGLAQQAHPGVRGRIGHAFGFLFGVVLSFGVLAGAMLAMRAAGEQVGWGFQLQSPIFVSAIALLFFVLALNLPGYFDWGTALQSFAGRAGAGKSGALLDGALAVLVASPCTAPLMGAAIGYTLVQPGHVVFAVFTAMALGMAAPYVMLALYPAWARKLPKSGPWLASVRQFFAFPLYATVLWLVWVLGELAGLGASIRLMVLLLAVALGIWLAQRRAVRVPALAAAGVIVAASLAWLYSGIDNDGIGSTAERVQDQWKPWTVTAVAELGRQGKPVFVDFTAAWCVTCQVNKHAVLHTESVAQALRETGTVALRADWTRRDTAITQALAALGRSGVPVYALYDATGAVTVLPEILTIRMVVEALKNVRREPSQHRAAGQGGSQ